MGWKGCWEVEGKKGRDREGAGEEVTSHSTHLGPISHLENGRQKFPSQDQKCHLIISGLMSIITSINERNHLTYAVV